MLSLSMKAPMADLGYSRIFSSLISDILRHRFPGSSSKTAQFHRAFGFGVWGFLRTAENGCQDESFKWLFHRTFCPFTPSSKTPPSSNILSCVISVPCTITQTHLWLFSPKSKLQEFANVSDCTYFTKNVLICWTTPFLWILRIHSS